ncbi:sugar-binding transcriptional regulator [Geminicoccus flavidas]|uniref:sugar-binding transcriptional regulator n=1 Tax=Geminicoccus flavidas TaxID=2506407 RepID=UPI001359A44A|nr:sugar-binding transcriptional regulator [Geminicoccus flavidas]
MIDQDEQRRTRIAWLYYVEGRTQAEIAATLGINRVKVLRDLAAAREAGLVQFRIHGRLAGCVALERELCQRFGLRDAVVLPTPQDPASLPVVLGTAAGHYLSDRLGPGMTVGVGWGRTLRWSARSIQRRSIRDLTIVSLMGGLGRASEFNTYETAARLAEALDATCLYIAAPTYASSPALRDLLHAQDSLAEVRARAMQAQMVLFSVGTLGPDAPTLTRGLLTDAEQASLDAAGAVGDLLGHFLGADGRLLDHPVNRRVVGVAPDELAAVPIRILASGGPEKGQVMRAVLAAGYANLLITDQQAAEALCADAR